MIFRLQTRDLSPSFGSPLGAQLVDVYVHDPAAAATSTAASFPQRNYRIADGSAWSRLIEVQGFGQRYVDPAAVHHLQRAQVQPRPARPRLGLHRGADRPVGVLAQRAAQRRFAAPHCTVDPGTVPKAMDVITPRRGPVRELDYTVNQPVPILGVFIPN